MLILTYFASIAGESVLTKADELALLQVLAVAFIKTRIFFARIEIFVTKQSAPILLANAFPWRAIAGTVFASRVRDALVTQVTLATKRAAERERGKEGGVSVGMPLSHGSPC